MNDQERLPFQLDLSQLESHLWEAANILRGSPVDRTDWKSYILSLLFFKRICDVWDEEQAEMVATYGEAFADEHRFQVPEGCHWRDVRQTAANVGSAIVKDIPPLPEAIADFKAAMERVREAEEALRREIVEGGWLNETMP